MKNIFTVFILSFLLAACVTAPKQTEIIKNDLRPPAYPLVTIDPYTNAWAFTDQLNTDHVRHWTGVKFPLTGAIRVDGKVYRFMGIEEIPLEDIAPTAEHGNWTGRYTFSQPQEGWQNNGFNDSGWKEGAAAFGHRGERAVRTVWDSDITEIWLRRTVTLSDDLAGKKVFVEFSYADDFQLFINGIEVVNEGFQWRNNIVAQVPDHVVQTLKKGDNVIAAHCMNRPWDVTLDFGLWVESSVEKHLETAAIQNCVDVQATQTRYSFTCGTVDMLLTFTAPLLLHDLELVSRPVNYITYDVSSNDGQAHQVEIYFEASPDWALDRHEQISRSEIFEKDGLVFLKTGCVAQDILKKSGDDVRIDWGYFYLCAAKDNTSYAVDEDGVKMRAAFATNGQLEFVATDANHALLALTCSLGTVDKTASGMVMIGYDDVYSIQYFGDNLRPYWNFDGNRTIESVFQQAANEYKQLKANCDRFDYDLMTRATKAGGKKYAELCALAYRQAIAAHKLVKAPNGELLFFSKENSSSGSIGTVDVTYPSSPLFLLYNTELAKAMLNHIFFYSECGRWTKPFPAHDIGTYPIANGQTFPQDMPVEESGNMLILTAAIAIRDGDAQYAEKHWTVLTIWAEYLAEQGLDPENQLSADDFAGHLTHNTNLSIKAILGLASYGHLAKMLDKVDVADKYITIAREMAIEWMQMADDGDHYRLSFDKPGTWSQKYNLVWDKVLKFNIFPEVVITKEIQYYLTIQNKYGLPLDSRKNFTKPDWIMWSATLAPNEVIFEQFIGPLHLFMKESATRAPMTDLYWTDKPYQYGMQARSVVGGFFMKMLNE